MRYWLLLVLVGCALLMLSFATTVGKTCEPERPICPPTTAGAVNLRVLTGHGALLCGKSTITYVDVEMRGGAVANETQRPPLNLAIVLDKSGSMQGDKIEDAKAAAIYLVQHLRDSDIVSIVTYDSGVRIVVPATRATDRNNIIGQIRNLCADGNTALFDGVSSGWSEVKKFQEKHAINRIILLSDGLANVGPSQPSDLANLGAAIGQSGISVTTIGLGLGYNEDLMTQLARTSEGNHAFVEHSQDLAYVFERELGELAATVAKDLQLTIRCEPGVRPVRLLGRMATISGQTVQLSIGSLAANQLKSAVLEVEITGAAEPARQRVALATVNYLDIARNAATTATTDAAISFTTDPAVVEQSVNREVMVLAVQLIANENNKLAVSLRDCSKTAEARQCLESNAAYLETNGIQYQSDMLAGEGEANRAQSKQLDEANWNGCRKAMRNDQYVKEQQQSYNSTKKDK